MFVILRKPLPQPSQRLIAASLDGQPSDGHNFRITHSSDGLAVTSEVGGKCELRFANGETRTVSLPAPQAKLGLSGSWEVSFKSGFESPLNSTFTRLESWTENTNSEIKFYSGAAVYHKTLTLLDSFFSKHQTFQLDLGAVRDLATVRVNGKELATRWLAPFTWDITDVVRPGENHIEVEIINTWNNRLVGDAAVEPEIRKTFLSLPRTVKQESPLLPAGLLGPVEIRTQQHTTVTFD